MVQPLTITDTTQLPRRTWRGRFSLRLLLICLTFLCLGLGYIRYRQRAVQRQEQISEALRPYGVAIIRLPSELTWLNSLPGGPIELGKASLGIPSPSEWRREWFYEGEGRDKPHDEKFFELIAQVDNAPWVVMCGSDITDDFMEQLILPNSAEVLEINAPLGERGVCALGKFKSVRTIYGEGFVTINRAGLRGLAELSLLEELYLSYVDEVEVGAMAELASNRRLHSLHLGSGFWNQHIAGLETLPALKHVDFSGSAVRQDGISSTVDQMPDVDFKWRR